MTRLAMIGRADDGGLGTMLWEFARHMRPTKVLLFDLGRAGRGTTDLTRYAGLDVRLVHGLVPRREDAEWLTTGVDVLYTAETWYHELIPQAAQRNGVRTVLHAMPELHRGYWPADEVWLPTTYRAGHFPHHRVVPVPVALDRFEHRTRTEARHIVHLAAPAMLDRNGTGATTLALNVMRHKPEQVTFIGGDGPPDIAAVDRVNWKPTVEGAYWSIWPKDADLLVMPRRYAGLSLPVLEAAAQGIPTVMTDVSPQNEWPVIRCAASFVGRHPMAGGGIDVCSADVPDLTRVLDELVSTPRAMEGASKWARVWAIEQSWTLMAPRYRELFAALA